jgi:hypothetical protein
MPQHHVSNPTAYIGRFAQSVENGWIGKILAVEDHGEPMFKMQGFNTLVYLIGGKPINECMDDDDTQWFAPADVQIINPTRLEKPSEFEARMEQERKDANTGTMIALGVIDD